jgi:hypothetical protein
MRALKRMLGSVELTFFCSLFRPYFLQMVYAAPSKQAAQERSKDDDAKKRCVAALDVPKAEGSTDVVGSSSYANSSDTNTLKSQRSKKHCTMTTSAYKYMYSFQYPPKSRDVS